MLAAMPAVFGACGGAALLVLLVGSGAGQYLLRWPMVHLTMSGAGLLWLNWLAWKIYCSPAPSLQAPQLARQLGLLSAASLQLINPKTWMLALAVVSVFASASTAHNREVAWLSLTLFLVALPCLSCWALLGAGSARWLRSPKALQRLNRVLAIFLLISAWSSLLV
jgi:threonine/homoserine/homoserine lactone efflux protein